VRFGIDATGWTNRRGFGRFTRNAVGRLVESDGEVEYVLVVDAQTEKALLPRHAGILVVQTTTSQATAAGERSSRSVTDVLGLTRAVRRIGFDAFLFPSLQTWFPWPGAPTVIGVHDTLSSELPELTIPRRLDRWRWRAKEKLAVHQAKTVFAVSVASQEAVANRFGLAPDSIPVVPEAPDAVFTRRGPDEVERARNAIGVTREYVLFAGGISPHKDVTGLVDAYARVRQRMHDAPALVLAGALDDEVYASSADKVRERIAEHGLNGHVLLPGFVPDDVLAELYTGALLVINPSLGEGFGLPAVEAAACGAAVLLSDLPAHRESLGDAAAYAPPGDYQALADAMIRLITDANLRTDLGARARERVSRLTWDEAAKTLGSILREAAR